MYAVGRLGSYIFRGVDTVSGPFHPFGGAVDIIVVEQPDGSFKSSPWYVRFGKFQGVLKTRGKVVNISVNGVEANFHMYLDHKGGAYFLKEADGEEGESVLYHSSSGDDTDGQSDSNRRPMKSKSCNFDADKSNSADQVDVTNGRIVGRTSSRRSRIFGFVFGQRSSKDDSYLEGDNGAGIVRRSSLERAEIAADLLEVKWSTNLASSRSRRDNASQFSSYSSNNRSAEDTQLNDERSLLGSSVHDNSEICVGCVSLEKTDSLNENADCGSHSDGLENVDCSFQEAGVEVSCLSTTEQVEISMLGRSVLEEKCETIVEMSRKTDEFSTVVSDCDDNITGAISELTGCNLGTSHELEECSSEQFDEMARDERIVVFQGRGILEEESRSDRLQSIFYRETMETSMVGMDGSAEFTQETLRFSSGECGDVHIHTESMHTATELLSEDKIVKHAEVMELGREQVEVSENSTNPHACGMDNQNEVHLEEHFTALESCTEMVNIDPKPSSVKEREPRSICSPPSCSDSVCQVRDHKYMRGDLHPSLESVDDSHDFDGDNVPLKPVRIPASEGTEEEQFLFSDLDDVKLGNPHFAESVSPDCVAQYGIPEFCAEGNEELKGSVSLNNGPCLSPNKFIPANSLTHCQNSRKKPRVMSSPIDISSGYRCADEEVGELAKSLPNMWSPLDKLDAHDWHFPLSHSLDSSTKTIEQTLLKVDSSAIKDDVNNELELAKGHSNAEATQVSEKLKEGLANPAIELSLCKHLLYEGMGADAAAQAFDAEKLDVDKYNSLGPEVVKNENLIVKIGGHYFPWDAAAPIILGMVVFGSEKICEPKGMIVVDRVEKCGEDDSSKAIIPSGGSWRLWPFSFKRSTSRKGMQRASSDAEKSDAQNALEGAIDRDLHKNMLKHKVVKKTIRVLTPTSEQLASLNLHEGRNTITFTFFTPMLGKQQVDARIYLWKWNTRVVISDVDGTITKSDVLGQFMPLVGKDWSQTGVAHLFSAIKENGYQLLFLSARAISQAYHTRQFLINLKQDGKALPEGPVVISPDGLFPSLFREVIRRAPHEFKIACLEDIRALFPPDCNPFYAGFGNRDTDEISYLKVGIPKGKIFIINPRGEVAVNRRVDTKSYMSLHALVHGMFPPMTSSEQEDFNSWNYWKIPPPAIDI